MALLTFVLISAIANFVIVITIKKLDAAFWLLWQPIRCLQIDCTIIGRYFCRRNLVDCSYLEYSADTD